MKAYYGNMNERQFRNVYRKAIQKKGNTTENLIGFLERRLDTVIYRAKFAITVFVHLVSQNSRLDARTRTLHA